MSPCEWLPNRDHFRPALDLTVAAFLPAVPLICLAMGFSAFFEVFNAFEKKLRKVISDIVD